jgi:alkaline phosphatase D
MAGNQSPRTVTLWLQTNGVESGEIKYSNVKLKGVPRSFKFTTSSEDDYALHAELFDLEPGSTYTYEIIFKSKTYGPFEFRTLRNGKSEEEFRVLTGSCAYINNSRFESGKPYGAHYEIFETMAKANPDVMLWLGDNSYLRDVDFLSPWSMNQRFRKDRSLPQMQALLHKGHHYAIWDDHDYGPNDSTSSFIFKDHSLKFFKRYWANPTYGLNETPGIFTSFRKGDAEFFLLDDRFNRDADRSPNRPEKQMFGPAQMRWLKNALVNSNASFKIIAGGSQMFNDANKFEGWQNFPQERKDFLDFVAEARITGLFFLTGDRHHTELAKIERPGTYPIYELTCSPLTSGIHPVSEEEKKNGKHLPGTLIEERNFCQLDFGGAGSDRRITVSSFDPTGKMLWEKKIQLSELGK